MMSKKKVAILGSGIAGLSYAYYLKKYKPDVEFVILESSSKSGGLVFSEITEGCVFEWGPRGVRPKGNGQVVLEMIEELGLWDELVFANDQAKKRYLYHDGKLQVLPHSLRSFMTSPYLGLFLKAFYKDLGAKKIDEDETIAAFVDRHFGASFRALFFDSLVSGVWAGDVTKMSVSAAFPILKKLESKRGSLLRSLIGHKSSISDSKQYPKEFTSKALFSFKKGLQSLTDALNDVLSDFIQHDVAIEKIDFSEQVEIHFEDASICVDELVSTLPAHQLSAFVKPDLARVLDSIFYAPVAVLNLILPKTELSFDGFGFLVPSKEQSVVLGMVANSNTFPSHAAPNKSVYTVMMGGARYSEEDLNTMDLEKEAIAFLNGVFGKSLFIDNQELILMSRAIPQYELGHVEKVRKITSLSPEKLSVLGSYMYGVSLIDIISKSKELAGQSFD